MKKAIIFPGKYIQGEGVLAELGSIIAPMGCKKPLIAWGSHTKAAAADVVLPGLAENGLDYYDYHFGGECTKEAAHEIADAAKANGCDIIVGLGGGKCLDVTKGAAVFAGLRVISCPTLCSNDSPTSACTVWYDEEGTMLGFDLWPNNPDAVVVDTGIIVKAPERTLKAGLGDALATYLEAAASNASHAVTCAGGAPTMTVMAMAKLCYDTILQDSDAALLAREAGHVTPAFERIVEACNLLSGIGWESGGLATAHQIGNLITAFPETHPYMHGEKVAFGIITQLMLDMDFDPVEADMIIDFMIDHDLPVTLADIGLGEVTDEALMEFCVNNTGAGSFCSNHNFPVEARDLFNAMKAADVYGKARKADI